MKCPKPFLTRAIAFACALSSSFSLWAAPVSADKAANAVQGWLHQDHRPLGAALSAKIKRTESVKNAAGETLYYVVHLDPTGFVILPADDLVAPVVAFSATEDFDSSSQQPLVKLVNRNMPRRLAHARASAGGAAVAQSRQKWQAFLAGSPNPPPDSEENSNITAVSQIWVAPFLQTLWNQQTDVSLNDACYNYYVPPYAAGTAQNDPCGCVATCMAQVMYYFQYPNTGVGTASFSITNNGSPTSTQLLGGDGAGGVYKWSNMPLSPDLPTTAQATAIGALTHDAGATIHMYYTPDDSTAYTAFFPEALTSTFKFTSADYDEDDTEDGGITGTPLLDMINPNLDARLPVALGIEPDGGHCLLCDGYGYSASTLFHHLNFGWGGDDDIWYALPDIETSDNGVFSTVEACVYNIFTNGIGQIISGRGTDPTGAAVAGATVTAVRSGGGTYTATTDTNGIYALARILANSTYTLTVTDTGYASATGSYSTGASVYYQAISGNVWGANFTLSPPLLVIPETGFSSIGPVGGAFSVTSQLYTLTNSSGASLNWALSSAPFWLTVSSSSGTIAAGATSSLTISLASAANSLAAGNYSTSIWATNVSTGLAQQLQFSLSIKTADYPIAVTGFNMDVVVENNAVGGNIYNYADAFDPACFLTDGGPACFYESGLVATNEYGGPAALGLPASGLLTSESDHVTTFQLAPYNSSNVLYLTSSSNSGSLTLNTPAAYKSLSVLAASAQGGGNGTLVIHFANGSISSPISFNATNYMTTNPPTTPGEAFTNFGTLNAAIGNFNEYYSVDYPNDPGYYFYFPSLYQTTINLQSLGLNTNPISSVTFTMPNGSGTSASTVTGVFALSGTESPATNSSSSPVSFVNGAGGLSYSGGHFTMELTNLTQQGQIIIFASTNLLQWVPIYTNPSASGTVYFTDTNAALYSDRFYRATTP
jgi:hypothetical protein